MSNRLVVVAYGGGLNSTAMLVGMRDRCIEPDLILFADTGGEKPETIEHIATINRWLSSIKWPEIQVVQTVDRNGVAITLEGRCLDQKMLPSLAYGFKGCSEKHKRRPQDKYVNNWEPARTAWKSGELVTKAIGYDTGEERRVRPNDQKYRYWYPLIEWGWSRDECEDAVKRASLPIPMKSACFFCPASKKREIDWLRENHPDLFDRAIAMENNALENLTTVKGLGRSFSWSEYSAMTPKQKSSLFDCIADIPCGCFDEGE